MHRISMCPRSSMLGGLTLLGSLLVSGCGQSDPNPGDRPGQRLAIAVAPLSLPGITNACYNIAVTNGLGQPVWSQTNLCADDFGDGQGALSYVGPCDASSTAAQNTVTLEVVALYANASTTPIATDSWVNPCPVGGDDCQQIVTCRPNADAPVRFDLTIMRDAGQGFFDIAVNFDDIFCSAKVDCAYPAPNAGPIELLHKANGARGPTLVMAFACTAGPDTATDDATTTLHMNDIVIDCPGTASDLEIDPAPTELGNVFATPLTTGPIFQALVTAGVEAIFDSSTTPPREANKLYWSVALGVDPVAANGCSVTTSFTASEGPDDLSWETPGTSYPVIGVVVPLTNAGGALACGGDNTHGLDDPNDPVITTGYLAPGTSFDNCANDDDGDLAFCGQTPPSNELCKQLVMRVTQQDNPGLDADDLPAGVFADLTAKTAVNSLITLQFGWNPASAQAWYSNSGGAGWTWPIASVGTDWILDIDVAAGLSLTAVGNPDEGLPKLTVEADITGTADDFEEFYFQSPEMSTTGAAVAPTDSGTNCTLQLHDGVSPYDLLADLSLPTTMDLTPFIGGTANDFSGSYVQLRCELRYLGLNGQPSVEFDFESTNGLVSVSGCP